MTDGPTACSLAAVAVTKQQSVVLTAPVDAILSLGPNHLPALWLHALTKVPEAAPWLRLAVQCGAHPGMAQAVLGLKADHTPGTQALDSLVLARLPDAAEAALKAIATELGVEILSETALGTIVDLPPGSAQDRVAALLDTVPS
ncbi:MAG: hypothetical protein ACPGYL_08300 [Rhodospirillaceae bacterium]